MRAHVLATYAVIAALCLLAWAAQSERVAAEPTSSADKAALDAFVNTYAQVCSKGDFSCMDHLGRVGAYAVVGFTDHQHSGGAILAEKSSGTWTVLSHGGGRFIVHDLLETHPAMSQATASALLAEAKPVWTSRCSSS